jgi:hypothetical protein
MRGWGRCVRPRRTVRCGRNMHERGRDRAHRAASPAAAIRSVRFNASSARPIV